MRNDLSTLSLEDKLYHTRFETDHDFSHITVDDAICRRCLDKLCLYLCPAQVYKSNPNDDPDISGVVAQHENCLECGTCRVMCVEQGVRWRFPNGGMGVKYRYG